jgi:phosphoglycolate phosphatase
MPERLAILFDIDGTLISSGGAGAESWRLAFEELYGVPADIGRYTDPGMTDPEVGRLTFKRVLGREPDAREFARLLARRNELLGLTTGGVETAAPIKLERGHLNRYFHFGGYGSDSMDRTELTRKAIEPASRMLGEPLGRDDVLVVGDTPLDIEAAHGAGLTAVGVATGNYGRQELADADYVLASLEEELPL